MTIRGGFDATLKSHFFDSLKHKAEQSLRHMLLGLKINQQRDALKAEKCNNHGVKLLYLRYDYSEQDFENLVQDIRKIIDITNYFSR